jgi:hypothetical protein
MNNDDNNGVSDEVELLKSIYPDAVLSSDAHSVRIEIVARDHQADASTAVRATLLLRGDRSYPNENACDIIVEATSRGVDAEWIGGELTRHAKSLVGAAMMFDIVEKAFELVTERNSRPQASCSICLGDVGDDADDAWLRTACMHFFHVDCLAEWYHQQRTAYHLKLKSLAAFHDAELRKMAPFALLCPDCRAVVDRDSRALLCVQLGDRDNDLLLEPWTREAMVRDEAARVAAAAADANAEREAAAARQRQIDEYDAALAAAVTPCVLATPVPRDAFEALRAAVASHACTVRPLKHPATRAHTGVVLLTFESNDAAAAFVASGGVRLHSIQFKRVDLAVIQQHAPVLDDLVDLYALRPPTVSMPAPIASEGGAAVAPAVSTMPSTPTFHVLLTNLQPKTTRRHIENALAPYGAREFTMQFDAKGRAAGRAVVRFDTDESIGDVVKQLGVIRVLDRVLTAQPLTAAEAAEHLSQQHQM